MASHITAQRGRPVHLVVKPPGAEVTGTQKTMSVKKEKVTTMGGEETRVTEMSPQFLQPLFPSINAVEGQTVTMECLADGAPLPQIMWTHAARVLEPSRRHELHFKNNVATLVIHSVNAMDSGDYVCRAFNDLGEITTKCVLRVGDAGRGGVQIPLATGGPGRPGMPPSGSRPGSLPAQHTTPAPQGAEGVVMNLGPGQVPHMQLGQSATFQLGGPQQMMTTHQQQMTQQMVSPGEIIIEGGSSTMQTHEMYEQMTSYQTQGTPMEASSYQTQQIVGGPSQQTQQVSSSMSNLQQQKHMIQQHIQSQSPVPMARSPQPAGRGRTMTTMRQQYSGKSGRTSPPGETFHASLERPKQTVPLRRGGHSTPPTMSPQMQHRTFQRIEMMTSRSESRSPVRSRQITPVRGGISSPLPPRSDRSTPQPEAPRFTLPLRDLTVNDGDKASFKVCFRGHPPSKVSWFFNSEMIIHSQDFHITIDIQRGECTLIIKEVFPDDEGEYMCKAENSLGAAVTVCHLFVRLPSSSEEDLVSATSTSSMMAQQHMTSVTTKDMLLQAPMQVRERSSFSETISIDTQKRYKEFQMQFQLPERKSERSEIMARQDAALRGMRMDVDVQLPTPRTHTETKTMMLNKQIDVKSQAQSKHLAYLNMDLGEQRRFSETVAIDRARSQPVQLEFTLPEQRRRLEKSAIQIRQQAALRGMKMEVEVPEQRTVSQATHMAKKRAEAIGTKRQEVFLELGGEPPHFSRDLASAKVMDGEEVKFSAKVTGNPMPEVTWYKNNKVIVENPDFHMTYDRKTGETTLHIVEVFPQDTGEFRCIAVNQYGRAVTGATLQVDVFEYVADSEEASASAAESHDGRLMSEDEVEFLERTQAFIANMQKLRQELQEEQVNEESIEMSERYDEETVQMAEVNWQIPSRGTEHVMRPEDEILHLAQPMDAVPDEGLAQEQRVRVNLAQPAKKPRLTAQAHEQMERMQIEQGAEFQADYQVQKTEGEAVTAERDQAYLTHAEGALAAPVTEVVTPEQGADLGAEYDEMQSHEERVRVDMQVPDVVDAKPSQIQHTREMVTPEMAKADIVEFPENLVEGDNVNVSLESGHLKSRPLQLAGPMAEKVMPELVVAQIDDSIKEARLIPGVVMPEYEPAMLEWYRLEIRVAPGCIQPLYPDDEVDMTQTQLTLTDMKAQYEEDQRILQEAQVNQQLAQVTLKSEAATPKHVSLHVEHIRKQQELKETKQFVTQVHREIPKQPTPEIQIEWGDEYSETRRIQFELLQRQKQEQLQQQKFVTEVHRDVKQPTPERQIEWGDEYSETKRIQFELLQRQKQEQQQQAPAPKRDSPDQLLEWGDEYTETTRFQYEYNQSDVSSHRRVQEMLLLRHQTEAEVQQQQLLQWQQQQELKMQQQQQQQQQIEWHQQQLLLQKQQQQQLLIEHQQREQQELLLHQQQYQTKHVVTRTLQAPVFEIPLSDLTVADGERAVLECKVGGVPRPDVTWFIDQQEITLSADFRAEYTAEGVVTLTISDVLPEDEGEYTVKAMNDAGSCLTTCYLTVLPPESSETDSPMPMSSMTSMTSQYTQQYVESETQKIQTFRKDVIRVEVPTPTHPECPRFLHHLEHKEVFETMTVMLECQVTGYPEPTITWFQDGAPLLPSERIIMTYDRGICVLTIYSTTVQDEAEYTCEAANVHGRSTSTAEILVERLRYSCEQIVREELYQLEIQMLFQWPKSNTENSEDSLSGSEPMREEVEV